MSTETTKPIRDGERDGGGGGGGEEGGMEVGEEGDYTPVAA